MMMAVPMVEGAVIEAEEIGEEVDMMIEEEEGDVDEVEISRETHGSNLSRIVTHLMDLGRDLATVVEVLQEVAEAVELTERKDIENTTKRKKILIIPPKSQILIRLAETTHLIIIATIWAEALEVEGVEMVEVKEEKAVVEVALAVTEEEVEAVEPQEVAIIIKRTKLVKRQDYESS